MVQVEKSQDEVFSKLISYVYKISCSAQIAAYNLITIQGGASLHSSSVPANTSSPRRRKKKVHTQEMSHVKMTSKKQQKTT